MKLYYSAGACSLAAHIALEEAGLKYEAISAPTKTKVLPDGSDYRQVNPLGYVPYLVLDDGQALRECAIVCQYVADQAPAKKLIPACGSMARKSTTASKFHVVKMGANRQYVHAFSLRSRLDCSMPQLSSISIALR
ncbi:MAG: glutathione S-transferase N-terminal domain-containing protein [Burkholderiales bacterium]|nr:glutathione S-transferase N-terminal domain-containing protein [Burkholderiales bacterium]